MSKAILELYKTHVVEVTKYWLPSNKTAALEALAAEAFKDKDFTAIKTNVGIVAPRWAFETPMTSRLPSTRRTVTSRIFVPGFGCKIADAVQASCSAYPFFKKKTVTTSGGEAIVPMDGGYCANNPTLYAIADATNALKFDRKQIGVVSVGVGEYPAPKKACSARSAGLLTHSLVADRMQLLSSSTVRTTRCAPAAASLAA